MDAGMRKIDVADAFARVQRLSDEVFPPASEDPASIRRYFTELANALTSD
jgi:hypothetical protein